MRLHEILTEEIDQQEAEKVLSSLIASGDPSAKYFQMTRYDARHSSVVTAQRAAERMAAKELAKQASKTVPGPSAKEPRVPTKPAPSATPRPSASPPRDDNRDDDRNRDNYTSGARSGREFYGNQYTGSLGKGSLSGLLGIKPNSAIGRAIGAVKTATKPLSGLKQAFDLGASLAPKKR
jgi:hypothetical protein